MLHALKNVNHTFLAVFLVNLCVLMINIASQLFFTEEKLRFINSLKQFLGSMICKKVKNKHYNKNLVMSAEDEERFQPSNKCWIFDKLFNARGDKVRDHCHVT